MNRVSRTDPPAASASGEHGFLAEGTAIGSVLRFLADAAGDGAIAHWQVQHADGAAMSAVHEPSESGAPFLSVITRTQGKRLHALRETLLCLAAQTCTDFELLVVGHKVEPELERALDRVLDEQPDWLRAQMQRLSVADGSRTRPLNIGFAEARGAYVAILDDDDLVLANWVEAFRDLARQHPGRVLRAATVRQDVDEVAVLGERGLRAGGPPELHYPPRFDLFEHLYENRSPPVSLAFPRSVFRDLGQRFDEALTTIEDWDYLLRVAAIVGVGCTPTVTSIYRWWPAGPSSRTEHSAEEWRENRARILRKMDTLPMLLPPGAASELRAIVEERDALRARLGYSRKSPLGGHPRMHELLALLQSTSWRLTLPLRLLGSLAGRKNLTVGDLAAVTTTEQAEKLLLLVRSSWSWRLTAPLRRLADRHQG
jgi:hypothetical protein